MAHLWGNDYAEITNSAILNSLKERVLGAKEGWVDELQNTL